MTREELYKKACELPMTPGVYIMHNKNDAVIYVGKSKVLRQRVSQYFGDVRHNVKTEKMVSQVFTFEYILTDTEIEALSLENKLIKLHMPKYNIRLKDAKSYPYIRADIKCDYPSLSVTRSRKNDGARYFGPYSSINTAYSIMNTARSTFRIPTCKKKFPECIGKERPCLYKQMGKCIGLCTGEVSKEEYSALFGEVMHFLKGDFAAVRDGLTEKMQFASDNLMFENAALYRDRIKDLDRLLDNQKAVSAPDTEADVFALYTEERASCLTVFYIRNGFIADSESFIYPPDTILDDAALSDFLCHLYSTREYVPKQILLDFSLGEEELSTLEEYTKQYNSSVKIKIPERGELRQLCRMAYENAVQNCNHHITEKDRDDKVSVALARILSLEVVPNVIEAIDISNMGDDAIVAGIVCYRDGKPDKTCYRTYNIKTTSTQDDYASMREAMERRVSHGNLPDLFLLDGGRTHVATVRELFDSLGIDTPVFGMVKDDFHKTRALTDTENDISIARDMAVFNFIYRIQEEVHRFTITKMQNSRSSKLRHSTLEEIDGIGEVKAKALLKHFKTIGAIKVASAEKLAKCDKISSADAENIYNYFHKTNNKTTDK